MSTGLREALKSTGRAVAITDLSCDIRAVALGPEQVGAFVYQHGQEADGRWRRESGRYEVFDSPEEAELKLALAWVPERWTS